MTFRDFCPVLYRAIMMVARWLEKNGLHKFGALDKPRERPDTPDDMLDILRSID